MIFTQHTINEILTPFIDNVFHYKGYMPEHSFERVVPTGHIYIIFELDGKTRQLFENDSLQPIAKFTKVWISGMHRHFMTISSHKDSEMLVIQFKAAGTFPFLHFPVEELNDKVIPAVEIFGSEILELRKNLKKANSTNDYIKQNMQINF